MFLSFRCPLDPAAWDGHTTHAALSQAGKAINTAETPLQL